ncbi:MAG: hypothetical protein KAY22_23615 [Rhizorhabdus sp.]|uniref:serine O-acetyltransferase n=1 Tax=Rhizorhabdus sp. TaxID=1968843 RepID=UPI001B4ACA32|nr:DapH/DapD/GlmU-related protein [Rhizorhabdus sp.]MBP8235289.1 hypothetical protein [Rhizorhabdus sp.]
MTDAYSFRRLVRADLRRYHEVFGTGVPTGVRFWLALFGPRFVPVLLYRIAFKLTTLRLTPLARIVSIINFMMFGIEIAIRCPIGPGFIIPHSQGTVIGAAAIGANATIFQGVTLGARELDAQFEFDRRPTLGDDVSIGSGAKVLGGIMIGDGAKVGANTVVLESLPPGAVAVGASARVILPGEGR